MNLTFKDLTVYKKAFELAMQIFEVSKSFPKEEKYSLTDQIRRSSRSVCSSIAEAYRKEDMKLTLFQRPLMPIWKTPKTRFGWNLLLNVNTKTKPPLKI
jgi:hypothetical protein